MLIMVDRKIIMENMIISVNRILLTSELVAISSFILMNFNERYLNIYNNMTKVCMMKFPILKKSYLNGLNTKI